MLTLSYARLGRLVLVCIAFAAAIVSPCAAAQSVVFSENFDDGNWTADPVWETFPADPSVSVSAERSVSPSYSLKIAANNNMGAIRTPSGLTAADQSYTCTFNLYAESIPEEAIPWSLQSSAGEILGLIFLLPNGRVQLTEWNPTGSFSRSDVPYPLTYGQWHSFKVTYDGTTQNLFIDGHTEPDASITQTYYTVPSMLCIGNFAMPHTGTIFVDDIVISADPGPPPPTPAKVYVQFCSDTSTGGINTSLEVIPFPANDSSYTSPTGEAAQVMAESYRMSHLDSLGNPIKLTWYMNCGSVYSSGLDTGPILPYELMTDNHGSSIARWGDEMAFHYHTWIWDGTAWVQADEFTPCLTDFERTVAHFVLDRGFYPTCFRSGWNWMSTLWENYLDDWFPYRFEGVTPSGAWTPYHPNATDWQAVGDQKGWESPHQYTPSVTAAQVQTVFQNALAGKLQLLTLWSHLKETDFATRIDAVHSLLAAAHAQYPTVDFEYLTGRECMLKWRDGDDVTPPVAEISTTDEGEVRTATVTFDEPVYQNQPFVARRADDDTYSRVDCTAAGPNQWTFRFEPEDTLSIAVAATDHCGNPVVRFLPLRLKMWGLAGTNAAMNTVDVEWETNAPADTRVEYEPYASGALQSLFKAEAVLKHKVTLTGLLPGTVYCVRASSEDLNGQNVGPQEIHIVTPSASPLIIDNVDSGFSVSGYWSTGNTAGGRYGTDYRYASTSPTGTEYASWTAHLTEPAVYEVSVWWSAGSNRSASAVYVVTLRGTDYPKVVNQQTDGGLWNSLGVYQIQAGDELTVRLLNQAPSGYVVIADAVKLDRPYVPVPGVAAARLLADGVKAEFSDAAVTALFDGAYYVESASRDAGIKVRGSGVEEGQELLLRGTLSTENGERVLIPAPGP